MVAWAWTKIVSFFQSIWDRLKGKPQNTVVIPNNQGDLQQVIGDSARIIKDSNAPGNTEMTNILSKVTVINIYTKDADSAVKGVMLGSGERILAKEVVEEKEKATSRKVNLLPIQYGNAYTHVRSKKYTDERILELVNRLDKEFQNKILTAIEIDELYKEGKRLDADSDRDDFAHQYGMKELKFVDLWTEGYLKKILIRLYEVDKINPKPPKEIKKTIDEFVASAETIFFIHRDSDIKNVVSRILNYSSQNREYIALHAMRSSVNRAKEIDTQVNQKLIELKYTPMIIVDERIEFSKVWYKGKGIETYKLLLEVMSD